MAVGAKRMQWKGDGGPWLFWSIAGDAGMTGSWTTWDRIVFITDPEE